jgi:hypothetical protein
MPAEDEAIGDARGALFDRLAALTRAPDRRVDELRRLVQDDDRLRVPPMVRNALRQRDEPV